jgi:hypothetical protein
LGKKLTNTCSFDGGRIIVQQEQISRAQRSWTNALNVLQEATPHSFIKFCIYCFFPLLRISCALQLEKKNYQHVLDAGPLEFYFLRPSGCLTNPFKNLSLCFDVMGKTPGPIFGNNFVKQFLSTSAIAITSWQDVIRYSLCSDVKDCGTKRAHNSLFLKSSFRFRSTTVLGMFKDSAIILDAI